MMICLTEPIGLWHMRLLGLNTAMDLMNWQRMSEMVKATSEPGHSSVRSPFQFGVWYPIESAPKDGTPVLVFSPSEDTNEPTNIIVAKYEQPLDGWAFCEMVLADISGMIEPEPTHWSPLLPPTPSNGDRKPEDLISAATASGEGV